MKTLKKLNRLQLVCILIFAILITKFVYDYVDEPTVVVLIETSPSKPAIQYSRDPQTEEIKHTYYVNVSLDAHVEALSKIQNLDFYVSHYSPKVQLVVNKLLIPYIIFLPVFMPFCVKVQILPRYGTFD